MIPKKIHYIWVGGSEMPELIKKCIESWKKFCPDYEIIRWDESNLDINKFKYAADAYVNKKWAFFLDVHRFDILKTHGGIYLDVDVELCKSLDEYLDCEFFSGFENSNYVNPGLIMGSIKECSVCQDIVAKYEQMTFNPNRLVTVCKIATKYLQDKYGLIDDETTQKFGNKVHIYSPDYFCPKRDESGKFCVTDKTVSIHHYLASWAGKATIITKIKLKIKSFIKKIIGKKNVEKIREKRDKKLGID